MAEGKTSRACDRLFTGKPQPIFEVDERSGDVWWETWLDGFAFAMDLRPDAWTVYADSDNGTADAWRELALLIGVALNESELDSMQINALEDQAPATIIASLLRLHVARLSSGAALAEADTSKARAKVGRNDPCPCGSGKKSKRCCG